MLRVFSGVCVVLVCALQYPLWWGEGSWRTVMLRRAAIAAETHRQHQLQVRNGSLEAEVRDLKRGLEALEERARHDLGWIKPGETFYVWGDHAKNFAKQ